jgi:hypothetical protein
VSSRLGDLQRNTWPIRLPGWTSYFFVGPLLDEILAGAGILFLTILDASILAPLVHGLLHLVSLRIPYVSAQIDADFGRSPVFGGGFLGWFAATSQ